jgi:hypothetical protein
MNIPQITGQYARLDLYAQQNTAFYFGFDVQDSYGNAVNVAAYSGLRFRSDANVNVSVQAVNVSSVLLTSNASDMNVLPDYYGYDIQAQANANWETLIVGTLRIDKSYG